MIKKTKKNLLINLSLVVISLGTTVLVLELIFFYVLDLKPKGYASDRFFQFSLLTGHFHKPNASGYYYRYNGGRKYHVTINSYGFSDSQRELQKKRSRIALIGDSTTEFWEADSSRRGQYLIEEFLGREYEVLNFGVRGFGTDQTYIMFQNVGVKFSPDIVVYTFCINDIWDNLRTLSKPYFEIDSTSNELILHGYPVKLARKSIRKLGLSPEAFDDFMTQRSFIYRRLRLYIKDATGYVSPLRDHLELLPLKTKYDERDKEGIRLTLRLISALRKYVESQGMKFLLVEGVYRPILDEHMQAKVIEKYGALFDFEKVSEMIKEHCESNQIELLSLPTLAKTNHISASDIMHVEDNLHLDERGIHFYAEAVAKKLHALGWVSENTNSH